MSIPSLFLTQLGRRAGSFRTEPREGCSPRSDEPWRANGHRDLRAPRGCRGENQRKTFLLTKKNGSLFRDPFFNAWSGKRDSNSRPRPWQGRALPTELFPRLGVAHFIEFRSPVNPLIQKSFIFFLHRFSDAARQHADTAPWTTTSGLRRSSARHNPPEPKS
jgi:hypothetical protein